MSGNLYISVKYIKLYMFNMFFMVINFYVLFVFELKYENFIEYLLI